MFQGHQIDSQCLKLQKKTHFKTVKQSEHFSHFCAKIEKSNEAFFANFQTMLTKHIFQFVACKIIVGHA